MRVMKNPQTFSSQHAPNTDGTIDPILSGGILGLDPPRHRQMRALITQAFTLRVVARLEPHITASVHDLLDQVQDRCGMDIVDDLAFPLPVIVIAEPLGVPLADREMFRQWSDAYVSTDYARRVVTGQTVARTSKALLPSAASKTRSKTVNHTT